MLCQKMFYLFIFTEDREFEFCCLVSRDKTWAVGGSSRGENGAGHGMGIERVRLARCKESGPWALGGETRGASFGQPAGRVPGKDGSGPL